MVKYFGKESRLIIIFFLTVIILGSVLVYLSINNISNYSDLTKKKISEEERAIALQFSEDFQSEMEGLINTFDSIIEKDSIVNEILIKKIESCPGIKHCIILNENGAYLWPHFLYNNNLTQRSPASSSYLRKIKIAENYEFVVQNYGRAETNYLSALRIAKSQSDSAHVFNAVSRLNIKMNQPEKAFDNYSKILSDFSNSTNVSGFPYAYYSVIQIMNLSDSSVDEEVQKLLVSFLSELSAGKILLNYSTSDLMIQMSKWTTQFDENNNILKINESIQHVSDYLDLINNYQKTIEDFLNDENLNRTDLSIGENNVLKPAKENSDEVLIFNKRSLNPAGFTIGLKELFDLAKQKQIRFQREFEYQVELIKNEVLGHSSNNEYTNYSAFSPYFSDHRVKITLENENIVEEYVFKRKMIYGIGFILLLGVMYLGSVLLVQDINREKKMERLRADFISNVTHELKTPLTSINMFAESIFLERFSSKHDLKKYANIIVKESENLKRMITNILEFSRKENNKLSYELKEMDLSNVVNSTLEDMNYWLEISNFNVTTEVANVFAIAEAEGLKQALTNLISNAIKYSPHKKELIVRLLQKEKKALIEVEDFGIGIPQDKLKLIFDKFYRVNSVENDSASGTGLGLTVTRDIIEAQSGEITVESTLGKGSKFTIAFNI